MQGFTTVTELAVVFFWILVGLVLAQGFLVFGFDMLPWRKYALAASVLVVLGLISLYWYNSGATDPSRNPAWTSNNPVDLDIGVSERDNGISNANSAIPQEDSTILTDAQFNQFLEGFFVNYQAVESDYGEYTAIGPDNLPMIVPLPNKIQMQVGLNPWDRLSTQPGHQGYCPS